MDVMKLEHFQGYNLCTYTPTEIILTEGNQTTYKVKILHYKTLRSKDIGEKPLEQKKIYSSDMCGIILGLSGKGILFTLERHVHRTQIDYTDHENI